MIKMIINDEDSNYDNVNEENGSQTIIFQIKHFRESFISEKPTFLVLSYVYVYSYWCRQITLLLAYNVSVMSFWHSYQSTMAGYNVISL